MIKYIGSKRVLVPRIVALVGELAAEGVGAGGPCTVLDLFSGTARVGHALKRAGHRVIAVDHNAYAATLARCYVGADAEDVLADAERVIGELRGVAARVGELGGGGGGYFTETFCERARFFHPKNGARIDAVRDRIEAMALPEPLRSVVLVSLMEAADRVDATTGLQMAYLKTLPPRAHNDLDLRVPAVLPGVRGEGGGRVRCEVFEGDALEAARRFEADIAYIDPPYNGHSYLSNYHVWETLVRWDRPETYGRACKRVDCKTRKSAFNSKRACAAAFGGLIAAVRAPRLVVSFNDEGYLAREHIEAVLGVRGEVGREAIDFRRYVGAQIGVYNPKGERVGTPGRLRNTEFLYSVRPGSWARAEADPAEPAEIRAPGEEPAETLAASGM